MLFSSVDFIDFIHRREASARVGMDVSCCVIIPISGQVHPEGTPTKSATCMTAPSIPKKRKRDKGVDLNPKDPSDPAYDYIPRDENGNFVQYRFMPFDASYL